MTRLLQSSAVPAWTQSAATVLAQQSQWCPDATGAAPAAQMRLRSQGISQAIQAGYLASPCVARRGVASCCAQIAETSSVMPRKRVDCGHLAAARAPA